MARKLPDWVEKHKREGVEIRLQRGNYYAYEVTSKWDPELGRSRKITKAYLGAVKNEGIVPARIRRQQTYGGALDAGNLRYLAPFLDAIEPSVQEYFPADWQSIMAAAALRLCYLEPCSRLRLRYETSLAKRRWPEAHLSDDALPGLLRRIGFKWDAQREVFAALAKDEKHMAIDLSHVFSESQNIPWLEYGHNGDGVWRAQLQVLLCWGTTTHRPGFLQLLLGATNSAQVIAHAVKEAPIQDLVAVVDRGFWSPENVQAFEEERVHYVMVLPCDLPFVRHASHAEYAQSFLHKGHTQWWRKDEWEGRAVYHYWDKRIAADQEDTWMRRIEKAPDDEARAHLVKEYEDAKPRLGVLHLLTDTGLDAAATFALYKERNQVEEGYNALQNALDADVTYMRSREGMIGLHFIFFLALHLYSQVLAHLKRKRLLTTYSVRDVLTYLTKVVVVEVDGHDMALPVTRQTETVVRKLEVPITEKSGL
ncbi:MAG: transposase [bacterium]